MPLVLSMILRFWVSNYNGKNKIKIVSAKLEIFDEVLKPQNIQLNIGKYNVLIYSRIKSLS